MLDLVEPLPVRNDRPADDQATHREHDARTAVLSLRQTVDLTDHDLQRPIDLRVPVARHPSILLGPSTATVSRPGSNRATLFKHGQRLQRPLAIGRNTTCIARWVRGSPSSERAGAAPARHPREATSPPHPVPLPSRSPGATSRPVPPPLSC